MDGAIKTGAVKIYENVKTASKKNVRILHRILTIRVNIKGMEII